MPMWTPVAVLLYALARASAQRTERVPSALTATEFRGSSDDDTGSYYPLIVMKGERHTGTNFLTTVLEKSFGDSNIRVTGGVSDKDPMVSCNPFEREPRHTYCCWKHGYASTWCHGFQSPDLPALPGGAVQQLPAHAFLVRSPYPWILAMHNEPYDYNGDRGANFSEFIRAPFAYVPHDYQGSTLADKPDYHANPIQLWNAKMRSYIQFESEALGRAITVQLTHEMLYDLEILIKRLKPLMNISSSFNETVFEYPPFSLYNDKFGSSFSKAEFQEAKRYEAEQMWLNLLSQEDLDFINAELERNVVEQLGLQVVLEAKGTEAVPQQSWRHRMQRSEHMRMLRLLDDSDAVSPVARDRQKSEAQKKEREPPGGVG